MPLESERLALPKCEKHTGGTKVKINPSLERFELMPISDYSDWNEEASIVWAKENDFNSPYADMSDDDIKQSVYDRMSDDSYDDDSDFSMNY